MLSFCSAPSSVTVKSLAVSPSIGLPFLSFTETALTTSWVPVEIVKGAVLSSALAWAACEELVWAGDWAAAENVHRNRKKSKEQVIRMG